MTFQGLTWDHPRGYDALAEAARRANAARTAPLLTWDKQPLEGFESAPITDLTARYDLVVLDHPHIGEAVEEDCLYPLEELFSAAKIAAWAAQSVGPSFASYGWQGRHWALPLDVATQVMARRPDLIAHAPTCWEEIEELAGEIPVALSLAGPHAFLSLISLAGSVGDVISGPDMLTDVVALPALARLRRLVRRAPTGADTLNPIALLEAMARRGDIALVPLVFGYVTYARAGHAPHVLAFSDTLRAPGGLGGVLGGTGIAVSRRCKPTADLLAHIETLLSVETQRDLVPTFGGQPSARAAWTSDAVNTAWGHFYRDTLATAVRPLVRPRFDGFPAFTNLASARLRAGLSAAEKDEIILADLRRLWRNARTRSRGPLDDKKE